MRLSILALASGIVPLALTHPLEKRENALPPVNSATDESVLQLVGIIQLLDLVAILIALGSLPRASRAVPLHWRLQQLHRRRV